MVHQKQRHPYGCLLCLVEARGIVDLGGAEVRQDFARRRNAVAFITSFTAKAVARFLKFIPRALFVQMKDAKLAGFTPRCPTKSKGTRVGAFAFLEG